jgi:hypothetical protein
MVMLLKALQEAKKGQSRILEAVIAAVILFIVFSATTFLIRSSEVGVIQERGDLDRLGYNVLHGMVESGTIEATLEKGLDNAYLKTVVQKSLPSSIYFNLTVFKYKDLFSFELVLSVSNAATDSFLKSMEVSSTTVLYTSKSGEIYYLVLALARAGEGV